MAKEKDPDWEKKHDLWKLVRSAVEHEDGLVNHRLTWLINVHWILFGIFGAIQVAMFTTSPHRLVVGLAEGSAALLFVFAILVCRVLGQSIDMASAHCHHLKEWWFATYPEERIPPSRVPAMSLFRRPSLTYPPPADAYSKEFPPVMGDFGFKSDTGACSIPHLFIKIDLLLIACAAIFLTVGLSDLVPAKVKVKEERSFKSSRTHDSEATYNRSYEFESYDDTTIPKQPGLRKEHEYNEKIDRRLEQEWEAPPPGRTGSAP